MNQKYYFYSLLLGTISFIALDAKNRKIEQPACGKDKQACQDKNNTCLCFCGFKPGPRNKIDDDTLIFIKDDPEGNYCYCKERDIKEVNRKRDLLGEPAIEY